MTKHLIDDVCRILEVEAPCGEATLSYHFGNANLDLQVILKPDAREVIFFCPALHHPPLTLLEAGDSVQARWGSQRIYKAVSAQGLWAPHHFGRRFFKPHDIYEEVLIALHMKTGITKVFPHIRRAA